MGDTMSNKEYYKCLYENKRLDYDALMEAYKKLDAYNADLANELNAVKSSRIKSTDFLAIAFVCAGLTSWVFGCLTDSLVGGAFVFCLLCFFLMMAAYVAKEVN